MKRISLIRALNRTGLFNWARWLRSKKENLESNKVSFYQQFISKGDLCFDIGANIGQEIEVFLKLGSKIIAVEPSRSCFDFLKLVYGKNKNVILFNKALGEVLSQQELIICEANGMSSLSAEWVSKAKQIWKDYQWNDRETVEVVTLDVLIERYGTPAFIKIDVEGYEQNVIKGLSQKVPFLSFELTPITFSQMPEIGSHLDKLGNPSFNLIRNSEPIKKDGFKFVFDNWVTLEELFTYILKHQKKIFCDVFVCFD